MANPKPGNRKARRADEAARRKNAPARTEGLPISPSDLDEIGASAASVARALVMQVFGVSEDLSGTAVCIADDPLTGPRLANLEMAAAVFIPFIAAGLLQERSVPCRVVAGSAIWSVGPGDRDLLDHGVQAAFGPEQDAARGNYHVWVETDDHLVDFATRLLPLKFADAAQIEPFSTPPSRWRRFPATIVHPRGVAMPDPQRDPEAPYAYREGSPALFAEVQRRVLPLLAEMHTALWKSSGA